MVTSVTLQAVPAFALHAVEGPGTLTEAIEGFDEPMTGSDHVEFYRFPHTDLTLLKRNTRRAARGGARAAAPLAGGVGRRDPRERGLRRRGRGGAPRAGAGPAAGPDVGQGARRPQLDRPRAPRVRQPPAGPLPGDGVRHPAADAPAVLAELRRVHEANDWRAAFPVEVRVAAADDIPLSTASGRDSAYIAAHVPAGTDPGHWFAALEAIAGEVGGRPHWGKLHGLDAEVLRDPLSAVRRLRRRPRPPRPRRGPLQRLSGPGAGPGRAEMEASPSVAVAATSRPCRSGAPGRCGSR